MRLWGDWRKGRQAAKAKRLQSRAKKLHARAVKAEAAHAGITSETLGQFFSLIAPPDGFLIPFTGFTDTSLERLLRASAWSWAAVNGNSQAMASLPVVVQERTGGKWVTAPDEHPLWRFVDDPLGPDKAFPYWAWEQLFWVTLVHRYGVGNAFWVPQVVDGDLFSVQPLLQPGNMRATENQVTRAPTEFNYSSGGQTFKLAPDKIVNIMAPSPSSFWKGLAPLAVALRSIETDHLAGERTKYFLRNMIAPGAIVAIQGAMGPTAGQKKTVKEILIEDFQASDKSGMPWVIGGNVTVHDPPKQTDMQLLDTRRYHRDEILAIIGMPPPVAGVLDRAILNNFETANRTWWNHYLFPILGSVYNTINVQLVRPIYGRGVRLWYDLVSTDIALQLFGARVDEGLKLQQLGYSTNDINEHLKLGLPERDYLNLPNVQLLQAGRAVEIQQLVEQFADGDADVDQPAAEGATDDGAPTSSAAGLAADAAAIESGDLSVLELTQAMQRIYLAVVNGVITTDEAREILNRAGAALGPTPDELKSSVAPTEQDD